MTFGPSCYKFIIKRPPVASVESVPTKLFFDLLVKMAVMDEINFKITRRFLGMQKVSKYFGFHEPPTPKNRVI